MKILTIECPDGLHEQLEKLVDAGWFKSSEAGVLESLRRYLSGHSVELQEKQILEDVDWALKGCPSSPNLK
jgi:Arc/MetJ-type ribon-helix-helix transcriptional regulator